MNAEYINIFIEAVTQVFQETAQTVLSIGNKSVRQGTAYDKNVVVLIGITGEVRGSIAASMDVEYAKGIASKMMYGMPVDTFDELPQSAIREMINMMMGKVASLVEKRGKVIDITPPILMTGDGLSISNQVTPTLVLSFNDHEAASAVDLDIAIKEAV